MAKRGTILAISAAAAFLTLVESVSATTTDPYWIAREAQLIVVGKLHPMHSYLWFDGWHMGGTIQVKETLFGRAPAATLEFHEVRKFAAGYYWWIPPKYPASTGDLKLWFLRKGTGESWQPSASAGFEEIAYRAMYEDFIRRFKR